MTSDRPARPGHHDRGEAAETVAQQHPQGGAPGKRKEVGNAASSNLHPPHVSDNADGEPIQGEHSDAEIPTLPANATGRDKLSVEDQAQPIDDESMYDRRPSEDKDRPPSSPSVP